MQRLKVSGAVRLIYVVRHQRANAVVSYIHSYHTFYDINHQYYFLYLLINGTVILLVFRDVPTSSAFICLLSLSLSSNVMVIFYLFLPQTPKTFMSKELTATAQAHEMLFGLIFLFLPPPLLLSHFACAMHSVHDGISLPEHCC